MSANPTQVPVVKSGRARQKPLEPETVPGGGAARYRCVRSRQYKGRVYYTGEEYDLPASLPEGFEEFFEKI